MLLSCRDVRIDQDGDMLVERLEFEVDGPRAALVGDFEALFALLSARAQLTAGSVEIDGVDAREAVRRGDVALVLAETSYEPRWTVLELLQKSAVLAGMPSKLGHHRARAVLDQLHLGAYGPGRLGSLGAVELRALGVALALLTEPKLIAAQAPLRGLSAAAAAWLWQVIDFAAVGRKLLVAFDEAILEQRTLLGRFDQVVLAPRGRVTAVGPARELLEAGSYLVGVLRGAGALREALEAAGCRVHAGTAEEGEPAQLLVGGAVAELTSLIARLALERDVPVIELVPLPPAEPHP